MAQVESYGAWRSPITGDAIVAESIGLGGVSFHKGNLYWTESRPTEGGRNVMVERTPDSNERDINPAPYNIRTRVHEYGGGASLLEDDTLYFINFTDQQVYRQILADDTPTKLTDAPGLRFANGSMDTQRSRIIYVIEDHTGDGEAQNYLGAVSLTDGSIIKLTEGHDFYSSPTLSPKGNQLSWLTWDHPDMPWDETKLWQANIDQSGNLDQPELIAGGDRQSVQQPRYSPDGRLFYVSDVGGWWNLCGPDGCVCEKEAEFGGAHWSFGLCNYQFADDNTIICVYSESNLSQLATLDLTNGELSVIEQDDTDIGGIHLDEGQLCYIGASPMQVSAAKVRDLDTEHTATIKQSASLKVDQGYLSHPEAIQFPAIDDETAHAFFYPPTNRDFEAPEGELPPLLVFMHGGPTSSTHSALSLRTQYWTSRGFAILDINYRGSTGYGRAYRDKLLMNWGIVDVEDTVHGVKFLVDQGLVDGEKTAIRGGSAGGFTVLAALTFEDTFKAGASLYGIGDLETLARDTHKFESRYLDSLIGPYPEEIERYKKRSPINHTEQLTGAVIFFQGLEDNVVPPNQAEAMVDALDKKGLPCAYVPFEGEQHGFRRAENIKRSLELELYFYGCVFGFTPADNIPPIPIRNLEISQ
ncbi:MAG TPA: peptidase [Gammaproteobacteria bacterium]|nr:peptidase [Gammaproteobacteria bacterium]